MHLGTSFPEKIILKFLFYLSYLNILRDSYSQIKKASLKHFVVK